MLVTHIATPITIAISPATLDTYVLLHSTAYLHIYKPQILIVTLQNLTKYI